MRKLLTIFTLLSLIPLFAFAENDDIYPVQDVPGDPIIITAELFPMYESQIPFGVDVFDVADITAFRVDGIEDVVGRSGEVYIRDYGGMGSLTSAAIRGAKSNQSLVMIDGQPINDIQGGSPDLNYVHLGDIERVEVYSGAASAVYGANAAGGVVNVITRDSADDYGAKLDASYGTGNTQKYVLSGEVPVGPVNFFVSGEYNKSDGFSSSSYGNGEELRSNTDYDGKTFAGKIACRPSSNHLLTFRGQYTIGELGVPGPVSFEDITARQDDTGVFINGGYRANLISDLYWLDLTGYYNDTERHFISSGSFPSDDTHKGKLYGTRVANFLQALEWNRIGVGFEYDNSSVDSTALGEYDTTNYGVFVQDDVTWNRLNVAVGIRYDKNNNYDSQISPRVGASYEIIEGLSVRGAYGQGYRAPSLEELFWPSSGYVYIYQGNPDLKPEKVATYEAGVAYYFRDYLSKVGVNYFRSQYDDLIVNVTDYDTFTTMPENIEKALISGISLESDIRPLRFFGDIEHDLAIAGNFTYYLNRDNTTDGASDPLLDYRPEITGYGEVTYTRNITADLAVKPAVNVNYVSGRQYSYYNPDTFQTEKRNLDAYSLVGAKVGFRAWWFEPYFAVDNALNTDYQSVYDYPMPGRTIYGGVTIEY
ncbi:MAG: TonB-dependent receptor [bacterium]|nr:TonB-dependent receptor [bacterium]